MATHLGPYDHKEIDWSATKKIAQRITRARSRESDLHLARAMAFLQTDNFRNYDVDVDDDSNKTSQIFIFANGKTIVLHALYLSFFVLHFAVVHILLALENVG